MKLIKEATITLTQEEQDELIELVVDKKLHGDTVTVEQEQTLESLYKKLTSGDN